MKNLFSRDNFLFPSFDKKQKTQSLIIFGLLVLLFLASAFTFMNMFYCFVDCIGSIVSGSADVAIKDLLRSIPLFASFFMTLWALLLVHKYFRNDEPEKRMKKVRKNALTIIGFGVFNIIYTVVCRCTGKFLSLVEGAPSPLYPLDALLYSIFFIALAVCAYIYLPRFEEEHPYLVPSRGPVVQKARFAYCLFITLWMLFALFTFGAFWIGLFIIDFKHGYAAFSFALLLVYLLNWCYFVVWELYFNELKDEKRKELMLPLGIIGLVVGALAAVFYFVALGQNLDGPSNVGFGVLPVAFAASVNIATMLTVALPIIVSVTCLIKGLLARKHKQN